MEQKQLEEALKRVALTASEHSHYSYTSHSSEVGCTKVVGWMPPPPHVVDVRPGLESLHVVSELLVQQKVRPDEGARSFSVKNHIGQVRKLVKKNCFLKRFFFAENVQGNNSEREELVLLSARGH